MPSRIDAVLEAARVEAVAGSRPSDVPAALERGAVLVDIRPRRSARAEGDVPGGAGHRTQRARVALRPHQRCPAARRRSATTSNGSCCARRATPRAWPRRRCMDLGLHRATDVIGGYHALKAAGVLELG